MAYSFRQDLFEDLSFDISCCHDADELQSIIEFGGGRIDKKRGENTITLLTRNSQSGLFYTPHRDLYCSDFILKCCIKNTILPLKDFLFQKSFFDNNFDPNNVLLGKISWDEAQLFLSPGKRRSIDKRPTDCLKINGQVPVVKMNMLSSSKEAKLKRTARHEFDEEDRQKIIDFIIANQDFNPADPEYWQKMAKGFSSHTWQSLKGHFRNKIYPCIEKYNLSKELEDNIRTRIEGSRRSRSKSLNKQQHQKGTEANGEHESEIEEPCPEENETEAQESRPDESKTESEESWSERNEYECQGSHPENDVTLQETSAKENTGSAAKKRMSVSKLTQKDSTPSSSPVRRSTRRSLAEQPTPKKTRLSLNF